MIIKSKMLFSVLLALAMLTTGYAQTLDKLEQFFDRIAEKNKVMGSLIIARDVIIFTNTPRLKAR